MKIDKRVIFTKQSNVAILNYDQTPPSWGPKDPRIRGPLNPCSIAKIVCSDIQQRWDPMHIFPEKLMPLFGF